MIFLRNTGKLCFATLLEGDAELQVMLSRDRVGEAALASWKADVDLGDHVLVTGEVGTSRRGELFGLIVLFGLGLVTLAVSAGRFAFMMNLGNDISICK